MKRACLLLIILVAGMLISGSSVRAAEGDTPTPTLEATFPPEPTLDPCQPQEAVTL